MPEPRRRRFSWWDAFCAVLLLGVTPADAIGVTVLVLLVWFVGGEIANA